MRAGVALCSRSERGSRVGRLLLVALCACGGTISTPELDDPPARGSLASGGSRAGDGGMAGGAAAGRGSAGGRSSNEAGSGGRSGGAAGAPSGSGEGGSSAGSAGGSSTAPPREYCDAVTRVFAVSCGNGSCHTNRGATIGDFGVGPEEAASYVSRGSVRDPSCGLIIDPREPENSLILTKVTGEYPSSGACGGVMPVGSFEISDEQIDCIADWVEQFRL